MDPRAELRYRPLLGVLGAGILLRLYLQLVYSPGIPFTWDAARFARATPEAPGLFDDYWMPAGYPGYLAALREIDDHLFVPIAIQHLLALGTAVVCYLVLRRLRTPRPWATAAAAVLLLSGDVLFLEHALGADGPMLGLTVLACCLAGWALGAERPRYQWLAAAGAVAACAALSRGVASIVPVVLFGVAIAAAGGRIRVRAVAGGAVLAGAIAVFGVYAITFQASDGRYAGMSDMSGWNLYARVAPFAVCGGGFTPPQGTEWLCDRTPTDARPGPAYYAWFGAEPGPAAGEPRGRFARAAIAGQLGGYAKAVGIDLLRYVDSGIGSNRALSGSGRSWLLFDNDHFDDALFGHERPTEYLRTRYSGVRATPRGAAPATAYQRVMAVHGWLLPILLAISIAGFALALRGPRIAIALFGLCAVGLFVVPVLTFSFDYRYGVPPATLLAIAAIVAAAPLVARIRQSWA